MPKKQSDITIKCDGLTVTLAITEEAARGLLSESEESLEGLAATLGDITVRHWLEKGDQLEDRYGWPTVLKISVDGKQKKNNMKKK